MGQHEKSTVVITPHGTPTCVLNHPRRTERIRQNESRTAMANCRQPSTDTMGQHRERRKQLVFSNNEETPTPRQGRLCPKHPKHHTNHAVSLSPSCVQNKQHPGLETRALIARHTRPIPTEARTCNPKAVRSVGCETRGDNSIASISRSHTWHVQPLRHPWRLGR